MSSSVVSCSGSQGLGFIRDPPVCNPIGDIQNLAKIFRKALNWLQPFKEIPLHEFLYFTKPYHIMQLLFCRLSSMRPTYLYTKIYV